MTLVAPDYAEEFAVISAWVSALVPWSVTAALGEIDGGSLVEIRFPFLLVRVLRNVAVPAQNPLVLFPWEAVEFYSEAPGPLPYGVWTVGMVVVALALVLSVLLYGFEGRLSDGPLDPVRTMGGLLATGAVLFTVSAALLQFGAPVEGVPSTPFPGVVVPVGVLFQFVFAYALLTVDRDGAA